MRRHGGDTPWERLAGYSRAVRRASRIEVSRALTNPDMRDHGDALKLAAGLDQKVVLTPEIVMELSDTRPTAGVVEVLAGLTAEARTVLDRLAELRSGALRDVDRRLRDTDRSPPGLASEDEA